MYKYYWHWNDISENTYLSLSKLKVVCLDGEFTGLNFYNDRICMLQIYDYIDKTTHIIHFHSKYKNRPWLKKLLSNVRLKVAHYPVLDFHFLMKEGLLVNNLVCTRALAKISAHFLPSYSYSCMVETLLEISFTKKINEQCSDWGSVNISKSKLIYACKDVIYLKPCLWKLVRLSIREGRMQSFHIVKRSIGPLLMLYHLGEITNLLSR